MPFGKQATAIAVKPSNFWGEPDNLAFAVASSLPATASSSETVAKMQNNSSFSPLDDIFEDDFLLMRGKKREESRICVISFTGFRHGLLGEDPRKAEFVGSALKLGDLLVISDKQCTYGNGLDVDFIAEKFAKWSEKTYDKIISVGGSLGGFNALSIGPLLGSEAVVAFVPRYSVHPDVLPTIIAKYVEELRDRIPIPIEEWKYRTAEDNLSSDRITSYIFHGGEASEHQHADLFAAGENRVHIEIPGVTHGGLFKLFKLKGLYYPLLAAAAERAPASAIEKILEDACIPYWTRSPTADAEHLRKSLKVLSISICDRERINLQQIKELEDQLHAAEGPS